VNVVTFFGRNNVRHLRKTALFAAYGVKLDTFAAKLQYSLDQKTTQLLTQVREQAWLLPASGSRTSEFHTAIGLVAYSPGYGTIRWPPLPLV
jgi:hypothetical protein